MAKMMFSLGFWMTLVLFVGLGYVLGAEHADLVDSRSEKAALLVSWKPDAQSLPPYENQNQDDVRNSDRPTNRRCNPNALPRSDNSMFPQTENWQRGGSTYAPGLSFTISSEPTQVSLCPGPVEIPATE